MWNSSKETVKHMRMHETIFDNATFYFSPALANEALPTLLLLCFLKKMRSKVTNFFFIHTPLQGCLVLLILLHFILLPG